MPATQAPFQETRRERKERYRRKRSRIVGIVLDKRYWKRRPGTSVDVAHAKAGAHRHELTLMDGTFYITHWILQPDPEGGYWWDAPNGAEHYFWEATPLRAMRTFMAFLKAKGVTFNKFVYAKAPRPF